MTENEAIKHCEERAKICDECGKEHNQLAEWLKELLKYREIGTVEECRESARKQKPEKPKDGLYGHGYFACGSCKYPLEGDESYCPNCGHEIQWEENI